MITLKDLNKLESERKQQLSLSEQLTSSANVINKLKASNKELPDVINEIQRYYSDTLMKSALKNAETILRDSFLTLMQLDLESQSAIALVKTIALQKQIDAFFLPVKNDTSVQ